MTHAEQIENLLHALKRGKRSATSGRRKKSRKIRGAKVRYVAEVAVNGRWMWIVSKKDPRPFPLGREAKYGEYSIAEQAAERWIEDHGFLLADPQVSYRVRTVKA